MYPKPKSLTTVGIVQFFLAFSFVIWLIFFPASADNFAWPVVPVQTAMFLGVGFMVRTFIGYHLWREKSWPALRWQSAGNFAFLLVILLATLWHIDELNWKTNIIVAHIWAVAYTVEPVILFLIEPRSPEAKAPLPAELQRGPVFPGLRRVVAFGLVVCVVLGGIAFLNPQFLDTRWPWELDAFDARIMAAFFAMMGAWCARVYFADHWGENRLSVVGMLIFTAGNFVIWLVMLPGLDPERKNIYVYGIAAALFTLLLGYYYYRQERADRA
jgi:hypothetical protein